MACQGREEHQLRAAEMRLERRQRLPPFFLVLQFVHLCCDDHASYSLVLQPVVEIDVFLHPAAARIQEDAAQNQRRPPGQIVFNQLFPGILQGEGNPGIPIPRQIDEAPSVLYSEKIDGLRATWSGTGVRQTLHPRERVEQSGLTHITSAQEGNFRKLLRWERSRSDYTQYKLC